MPLAVCLDTGRNMRRLTALDVLYATKGMLLQGGTAVSFNRVAIDSRTAKEGDLFLCLKGERFDGHDFVSEALAKGVSGILVRKGWWSEQAGRNLFTPAVVIEADDTLTALGDIASFWRRANPVQVVAITGSSGKTTTKEMTAGILAKCFNVAKTMGNFNNLVGLPLSLLAVKPTDKVAVLEMGMNRLGEIERLAQIARPDIGVITNVQTAHLEGLKTIEGVARAKGELYAALDEEDLAVFNVDDPHVSNLVRKCKARKLGFGLSPGAEVTAREIISRPEGMLSFSLVSREGAAQVTLQTPARHNITNALAASAVALAMGVDIKTIKEALEEFRPAANRLELIKLPQGITIINDTYNANPGSMRAALETLKEIKGSRPGIAVLGDMLELGEQTAEAHRSIGRYIAGLGIEYLIVMGEFAPALITEGAIEGGMDKSHILTASSHEEAVRILKQKTSGHDFVLVKGSRRMRMEEVVKGLRGEA